VTTGRALARRPPAERRCFAARPDSPAARCALPATFHRPSPGGSAPDGPAPDGPATGGTRLVRAVVAGGASASLAVAAHTVAGGIAPPGWLAAATGLLFIRLAYGLAGRRRGLPAVLGWLAFSQLTAHVTFALADHSATGAGSAHHHHMLRPAELLVELNGAGWTRAAAMTLAHLAAVVATGVLLHRADTLLWAAAALRTALPRTAARILAPVAAAAARLRRLLALAATGLEPALGRPGTRPRTGTPPVPLAEQPVGRAARRRGPPAARFATHLAA